MGGGRPQDRRSRPPRERRPGARAGRRAPRCPTRVRRPAHPRPRSSRACRRTRRASSWPQDDALGGRAASGRGRLATAFRSPIKFGGLATHQARRAAAAIARLAGADDVRDPGEPVLHGRLLVGHRTRRLSGRGDAEGAPLWWPAGKIAGEYLPRWLTEHGVTPPSATEPPEGGVTIRRPVRAMRRKPFDPHETPHASSAAPTRPSARSDARCVRRASADWPAARAAEPASRSRDSWSTTQPGWHAGLVVARRQKAEKPPAPLPMR